MSEHSDDGFTFVETLIVLTIILIMSAGVGFSAVKAIDKARTVSCKTQISTFKIALQSYYLDCGSFPTEAQGLTALWEKPVVAPVPNGWNGPYIDRELPLDPWNNPYHYETPGENGLPFSILSYGADAQKGGEKQDEDIVSWK